MTCPIQNPGRMIAELVHVVCGLHVGRVPAHAKCVASRRNNGRRIGTRRVTSVAARSPR